MAEIITSSVEETYSFAKKFAALLKKGDIVAFFGELGPGKTTMIKAIASYFEIDEKNVTSPTFTYLHLYPGIAHFDLYRISNKKIFRELGFEEYFDNDTVCLIEWAERIEDILPKKTIKIYLSYHNEKRKIDVKFPSKNIIITEKRPPNFSPQNEVSLCSLEYGDKILLLKTADSKYFKGLYSLPGGKLNKSEDPKEGAIREVEEETGLKITEENMKFFGKFYVSFDCYEFILYLFKSSLVSFPSKIILKPKEHDSFLWTTPKEALSLPILDGGICIKTLYKDRIKGPFSPLLTI